MKKLVPALSIVALSCSLAACGARAPGGPTVSVEGGVVSIDSHQGGGGSVAVKIDQARDASYTSQSIVHRWTSQDVTEFDLTLNVGTGSGMNALSTVQVFPKALQPQTEAVFSHLRVAVPYVVSVLARGNVGGIVGNSTQVLNTQNPADALVLFTSYDNNDIDNTKAVSVSVHLDSVPFSGTATVSLTTVDGTYSTPAAPESGAAD